MKVLPKYINGLRRRYSHTSKTALGVVACLFVLTFPAGCAAQAAEVSLDRSLVTYQNLGASPMELDIVELCAVAHIVCGVELVSHEAKPPLPHPSPKIALGQMERSARDHPDRRLWVDGKPQVISQSPLPWIGSTITVRAALDLLMASHHEYRWQIIDGVVNVLPKRGRKPKLWEFSHYWGIDPLDARIDSFGVRKTDAFVALMSLCERVFGKAIASSSHGVGHLGAYSSGPVTISVRDVSLQEALNQLVSADGSATWVVRPSSSWSWWLQPQFTCGMHDWAIPNQGSGVQERSVKRP